MIYAYIAYILEGDLSDAVSTVRCIACPMLLLPRDSASLPRQTLALLVPAALLASFNCFPELLNHSVIVPVHHAWANPRTE